MTTATHRHGHPEVAAIKQAAAGRWPEILSRLADVPLELLDGKHHPCPKCGGKDRFRAFDDFAETGGVYCNKCHSEKNSDGISTLQWATGMEFKAAVNLLAEHLGISNGRSSNGSRKRSLADSVKHIELVSDAASDGVLQCYATAKPPITPAGIRQCGGVAVRWNGHTCIRFDGRAPIDATEPTAIVLVRADGKPFPATKTLPERKTHNVGGSVNSWVTSGDVAAAETIIDVEGITDLLTVVSKGMPAGWVAVTNTSGAKARGKLPRGWAKGKKIIIAGDADQAGVEGQQRSAAAYVKAKAADARLAAQPYDMAPDHGKDLRDFFCDGHAMADFVALAEAAPAVTAEEAAEWEATEGAFGRDDKPRICAQDQNLEKVTAHSWQALHRANKPERLFRYGGRPSRIERDDEGSPITQSLDHDRMRYELARCIEWYRTIRSGDNESDVPAYPPKDVVRDVLACPDVPLPILTRIVEAPVFAHDGTLQTEPGYHAAGRTFYEPAPGFAIGAVPDCSTSRDVEAARNLICDELLGDFPFVGDSEKAHAVALMLLPFVRDVIGSDATPIHLVEKPTPGTGATLMVDCLAYPAIGRPVPAMTEGRDEDEWRKRLTAKFRLGAGHVFIDNLGRRLDSATVSAAITAPIWEDRLLGVSDIIRVPVRCVWIASGNNPSVSNEISRRSIRIRLDARIDRPWLRTGFRIPDLRVWVKENRGRLVWAALVLIRAWLNAGRPAGSKTLGMFESWAATMGGILDVAGVPGFLENLTEFYETSDSEGSAWQSFIIAWWGAFGGRNVKVSDLWDEIKSDTALPIAGDSEQAQKIKLGKLLSDKRDRTFLVEVQGEIRQLRIERGDQKQRAYLWRLRECVSECESNFTLAHMRAHARTNSGGETTHTHSPDSPPDACPHPDVEETPTFDGYINRRCRLCGADLPCRKLDASET